MPRRRSRNRTNWARDSAAKSVTGFGQCTMTAQARWSCRFGTDTDQLVARLHPGGAQLVGIADAGQHQQLR